MTRPALSREKAPRPNPEVSGHANLGELQRRKVEEQESLLDEATAREEAMTVRSLIEKIVVTGGLETVLSDDFRAIWPSARRGPNSKTPPTR